MKFFKSELNRIKDIAAEAGVDFEKLRRNIYNKINSTAVRSNREKYYTEFTNEQQHNMADLLLYKLEGDMICPCCGKHMQIFSKMDGQNDAYSIDHIIELQNGGTNNLDNLQVICFGCNNKKRDTTYLQIPVIATDKFGNSTYYESMKEASRKLNIPDAHSHICEACNHKLKSAYGFTWRFATTAEIEANKDSEVK